MLTERIVPLPDDHDQLVEAWLREHPRKRLPVPWVADKWKDDSWAGTQIYGRDDRLSVGHSPARDDAELIIERIGARPAFQVRRFLDGKT